MGQEEGKTLQGIAGLTRPAAPGCSMRLPVVVSEVEMGFRVIRQPGRHEQEAASQDDGCPNFDTSKITHTQAGLQIC